jgi:hypothetical protein
MGCRGSLRSRGARPPRRRPRAQDYLLSLTGDTALRELPSPGKSGSVFYLSDDERFLVKTVSREEARLLLQRVPAYFRHCAANPGTLLTRFYGVHRVTLLGGRLAHKARPRAAPAPARWDRRPRE